MKKNEAKLVVCLPYVRFDFPELANPVESKSIVACLPYLRLTFLNSPTLQFGTRTRLAVEKSVGREQNCDMQTLHVVEPALDEMTDNYCLG